MTKDQKKAAFIIGGIITGICINHIYHHYSYMRSQKASNTLLNDLRQTNANNSLIVNMNTSTQKIP
jgi:spore germination protein GerM